ncbi:MAG TPA: D-alanine--D-alanine ligase [Candidatus Saccharimonadales bacterium]|nr:D-alanine--D-alanine ligase [Candidatus Saccharimonadales bacterium]
MAKIVVLCGGSSPERAVSLRSGASVAAALTAAGHDVRIIDPKNGLQRHGIALEQADVVFPVLHGAGGEDGTIQQMLEAITVPFVGSSSTASALCFDKERTKRRLKDAGITVPPGEVVTLTTMWESPLATAPFVLKPVTGGSSIDTFIVRNVKTADKKAIDKALQSHKHMLLEALIEGTELTVGVLGETALPPVEIVPPEGGEFDYDNKYNGKTVELCPPVHITPGEQWKVQKLAVRIHHALGCRDLSRTDFILDNAGTFYALEINTLPGMTDQSLVPKEAAAAGIPMTQLVDTLVAMALARAHKS